ncbi:uncharacterized protein LOC136712312 isoform X1 [Amia ocellicauda]|uniref:uncharacterized protein LOC136712312 isoform X1 n=1 Tax=Amia ocellicauda TaxID=2972642 RepID=UPI003464452F
MQPPLPKQSSWNLQQQNWMTENAAKTLHLSLVNQTRRGQSIMSTVILQCTPVSHLCFNSSASPHLLTHATILILCTTQCSIQLTLVSTDRTLLQSIMMYQPAITECTVRTSQPPIMTSPLIRTAPQHSRQVSVRMEVPQLPAPDYSGINDIARYLARRELVHSGFTKFDNRPESYWAWKSSFNNTIDGLQLTPSEELDLMTKWLGPQSSEHIKRIRVVHISDPTAGLKKAWLRLEECYGSPEIIEKTLFDKLENFPKVSNRDPIKLRELGDLLREVESAKLEVYLPGLSYLDTARGVKPIVEKLPYGLQERWIAQGSQYKLQHQVNFPPFSFFINFVSREAYTRNDPSFTLSSPSAATVKHDGAVQRYGHPKSLVSAHKTEVTSTFTSSTAETPNNKSSVDRQCPIHRKPHPLKHC